MLRAAVPVQPQGPGDGQREAQGAAPAGTVAHGGRRPLLVEQSNRFDCHYLLLSSPDLHIALRDIFVSLLFGHGVHGAQWAAAGSPLTGVLGSVPGHPGALLHVLTEWLHWWPIQMR